MQQLLAIVDRVRDHYITGYLESLASFRASHSPAAPEVMFEIPRETGYPFRLYRADMASNSSEGLKVEEVNLLTHLRFSCVLSDGPDNAKLSLHPIAWNGVDFRVAPILDRAELEAWALKWLDVNDERDQDENGLQGVIHSVTEPKANGQLMEFSVDFGSAPVEAFEALVATLWSTGAKQIEVRSSTLS